MQKSQKLFKKKDLKQIFRIMQFIALNFLCTFWKSQTNKFTSKQTWGPTTIRSRTFRHI